MVLAEAPRPATLLDRSPEARAFLRFFGTLCSIPSVQEVACQIEGAVVHQWVRLNDDDEAGQDAIYDAWRRFQTADGVTAGSSELHVVFADEAASAIPSDAEPIFVRE